MVIIMKIDVRPLNKGETFCCPIKSVKEIFKNTSVHLNFAYLGRNFGTFAYTSDAYYMKNNIRGIVISSMYMRPRDEEPIYSFYVIKEELCSPEIKEEYEKKYLPLYYQLYESQVNDNNIIIKTTFQLVELFDGKLILHKGIYR